MIVLRLFGETVEWIRGQFLGSQKAIHDVVLLVIPQGVVFVSGFLTSILLARGLGPSGLGGYALVVSLSGMAVTLSDLGIGQTALRYASRFASKGEIENQFAILRWAFRVRVSLIIMVSALFFVLAPFIANYFWHQNELTDLLRLGLIAGVFTALASVPTIYFQSIRNYRKNAQVVIVQNLIILSGIVFLAWQHMWTIENVIVTSIVSTVVGSILFLSLLPGKALMQPRALRTISAFNLRDYWKNPLKRETIGVEAADHDPSTFALFNLFSTVIVMIILRADVWLMGYFLDNSQLGIYNAATRFTLPLMVLLNAMTAALWPRAAAQTSKEESIAMLKKTFRYSLAISVCAVLYAVVVPLLAPVLFGEVYAKSQFLGQLLCVRYAIAILICPIGVIGYNFGLVKVYWLINLAQLIAVIAINVYFLPIIGPVGSAIALLGNEIVSSSLAGLVIWMKIKK